jgi:hypothetical protein
MRHRTPTVCHAVPRHDMCRQHELATTVVGIVYLLLSML